LPRARFSIRKSKKINKNLMMFQNPVGFGAGSPFIPEAGFSSWRYPALSGKILPGGFPCSGG
jgi:hypothetical protein